MHRFVRWCKITRPLAALLASAPAVAQVPPAAPNSIPSRAQIEIPQGQALLPPSTVKVESRGAIARSACALDQSDVHVTIDRVRFTGPAGAELPAVLAPHLAGIAAPAGDQPIRVVCDVRDEATARLRRAGSSADGRSTPPARP